MKKVLTNIGLVTTYIGMALLVIIYAMLYLGFIGLIIAACLKVLGVI